jgi:hypothetical protein
MQIIDRKTHYPQSKVRNSSSSGTIPAVCLSLLFAYAACSKLADVQHYRQEMLNQVFPHDFAMLLLWILPPVELAAAAMVASEKFRLAGFRLSLGLMTAFTLYIALVLMHVWKRVPCSCGGVFTHLSWGWHLVLNIFFLLITIIGIYQVRKERRAGDR